MTEIKVDTRLKCNQRHPKQPLWCDMPRGHDGEHEAYYGWNGRCERWEARRER